MNLESNIAKINDRNNNQVFDYNKIKKAENFLSAFDLKYLDHGGSSICLVNSKDENVFKITKKDKANTVSSKFFSDYTKSLISKGISILPISIIYEDEDVFIYKQPRCLLVSLERINNKFVYDILNILKELLNNKIIIADMHYRNFGYYKNKCYLFDYCDENVIENPNNRCYVSGLYFVFSVLFKQPTEIKIINIIEKQFGKEIFPDVFSELLTKLYSRDYNNVLTLIDDCMKQLGTIDQKKYFQYQYVNLKKDFTLGLESHTLQKYEIAKNLMHKDSNIKSLMDAGGCIGGIPLKLAQEYPICDFTLNNITVPEIEMAKEISNKINVQNFNVSTSDIKNVTDSYDVVLYFALVHHLLKSMKLDKVFKLIKTQCKKYFIMEFPLKGDVLMDKVMKDALDIDTYNLLTSPETLKSELQKHFDVMDIIKMDYGTDQLYRYSFVCKLV